MRDGASGRSRGFGFLTFKDARTVNVVMVKEHYLDGKIVSSHLFSTLPLSLPPPLTVLNISYEISFIVLSNSTETIANTRPRSTPNVQSHATNKSAPPKSSSAVLAKKPPKAISKNTSCSLDVSLMLL